MRPQVRNVILPGMIAMAAIVLLSNILVQFLLGQWLTWGALTYPLAFLVTDLVNRLEGPSAARRVVLLGFAMGLICSIIGTQIHGEFGPLVTLRIALGSGVAFLIAQMLDVSVFDKLRNGTWWRAPVVSSLVGAMIDTALFFFIAFSAVLSGLFANIDVGWANEAVPLLGVGPALPFWVSLAVADFGVKVLLVFLSLIPFRMLVEHLRSGQRAKTL